MEPRSATERPGSRFDRSPETFAALRVREYRFVFFAGILTFVGVQAQQIARGQLAFELTGSNTGLGGVYLGFGVPMLLLTPVGGVIADRLPKRTALLGAQTLLVASAAWIAVADTFGVLEYWMLIGAAVLQGAGFAVFGPTRVALTGETVPRTLMGNAMALTQLGLSSTRVIAPALAGVLIAFETFGTAGVYMITTCFMVLSLLVTSRLPRRAAANRSAGRSIVGEFADGVRYANREPRLKMLILASVAMVMVGWPYLAFLPALSNDVFDAGSAGLGALSSVSAVSAVAVTLFIASRGKPNMAWRIQAISGMAFAVGLVAVAVSPNFAAALGAIFLVGGAASGYQTMNNTIVLTIADLEYHGRVQSLLMLSFSGFALAALPLGALADAVGLRATFAAMGGVCMTTMTVYLFAQSRHRRRGGSFDLEESPA